MLNTIFLYLGGLGGWGILLTYALILLFPLIVLIDCLKSSWKDKTNKLIWVIVIIILPLVGAIIYLILGRARKDK